MVQRYEKYATFTTLSNKNYIPYSRMSLRWKDENEKWKAT